MTTVPSITLNDGNTIPQHGSASSRSRPMRPPRRCTRRWTSAIATSTPPRCTATRRGLLPASRRRPGPAEVFITSKLNNGYHRPDDARRAFDATLKALRSDYVDLFLIHWPLPTLYDGDFVSTGRC